MPKAAPLTKTKPQSRKQKNEKSAYSPTILALSVGDNQFVICDTLAPIEYGCRVFMTWDNAKDLTASGWCVTKHPKKAKRGITLRFKNAYGIEGVLAQCGAPGSGTNVYRIVGECKRIHY